MTLHLNNAREAAYFAVLTTLQKDNLFAEDVLEDWRRNQSPEIRDFHLAEEIAYGSIRMALTLDHAASQLSINKKLSLKPKERALLRTALYQHLFMDKVPLYAIVDESTKIAKKHSHPTFVRFLHAILRQLSEKTPTIPQGDSIEALSIRYSYPPLFVELLSKECGLEKTKKILQSGNKPAPLTVRVRTKEALLHGMKLINDGPLPIALVEDISLLKKIIASKDFYIQNATPAALIASLSKGIKAPKSVLDLCASPGGKTVATHDLFPSAKLHANDVSEYKLKLLDENFVKYGIKAELTHSPGETFTSATPFDLVIVDAPCSNSGVFNKRPEARWRLTKTNLQQLEQLQLKLIQNAASLLSPHGVLWYMTCSILNKENEKMVEDACKKFGLQVVDAPKTILPNEEGWDGGFGCALKKKEEG